MCWLSSFCRHQIVHLSSSWHTSLQRNTKFENGLADRQLKGCFQHCRWNLRPHTSRTRALRLSRHVKTHVRFNGDTLPCSRPCFARSCWMPTPLTRSSQPMSPASSPPFRADWHSDLSRHTFLGCETHFNGNRAGVSPILVLVSESSSYCRPPGFAISVACPLRLLLASVSPPELRDVAALLTPTDPY